jgi:hypothetical protein
MFGVAKRVDTLCKIFHTNNHICLPNLVNRSIRFGVVCTCLLLRVATASLHRFVGRVSVKDGAPIWIISTYML